MLSCFYPPGRKQKCVRMCVCLFICECVCACVCMSACLCVCGLCERERKSVCDELWKICIWSAFSLLEVIATNPQRKKKYLEIICFKLRQGTSNGLTSNCDNKLSVFWLHRVPLSWLKISHPRPHLNKELPLFVVVCLSLKFEVLKSIWSYYSMPFGVDDFEERQFRSIL